MEFKDQQDFDSWLDLQKLSGWSLVFHDTDPSDPIDADTVHHLQNRVFDILTNHHYTH